MRGLPIPLAAVLLALALALAPAGAGAQLTVVAIEPVTAAIERWPYAAAEPAGDLAVGMQLGAGDLISAPQPGPRLELGCPDGSRLRLAAPFRATAGDAARGCTLHLLAGAVEIDAVGPVALRSAELSADGSAASWRARIERWGDGNRQRVSVIAGTIALRGAGEVSELARGEQLLVENPAGGARLVSRTAPPHDRPAATPAAEPAAEPPAEPLSVPAAEPLAPAEPIAVAELDPTPQPGPGPEPPEPAVPPNTAPPSRPAALPDLDELRAMLGEKQYATLVELLEQHVASGRPNSVECLLLARAHAARGRFEPARQLARRALRLDEGDNLLTAGELIAAQNLRDHQPGDRLPR